MKVFVNMHPNLSSLNIQAIMFIQYSQQKNSNSNYKMYTYTDFTGFLKSILPSTTWIKYFYDL